MLLQKEFQTIVCDSLEVFISKECLVFFPQFNICWKLLHLKSIKSTWFQQTFNNFVSFELLLTKLSGIHPYKKCIK